jgi:hypothetical protein
MAIVKDDDLKLLGALERIGKTQGLKVRVEMLSPGGWGGD